MKKLHSSTQITFVCSIILMITFVMADHSLTLRNVFVDDSGSPHVMTEGYLDLINLDDSNGTITDVASGNSVNISSVYYGDNGAIFNHL